MSEPDTAVNRTATGDRSETLTDHGEIRPRARPDPEALERAELEAFVDRMAAENRRLDAENTRMRNATYRRPALALAAVGVIALSFAVIVPSERTVLISLGGTGLFAGIFTYYLTPETFVSAEIGEQLQAAIAENGDRLVDQLGLSGPQVYIPTDGPNAAMLFIPQHTVYKIPPQNALARPLVITGDEQVRGLSLVPMGDSLLEEFERETTGVGGETASGLVSRLTEAVAETFEFADRVSADLDLEGGQVTFTVRGSVWSDIGQLDHPVTSLLAVSLAAGLDVPIVLSVEQLDERGKDAHVVLRWDETLRKRNEDTRGESAPPDTPYLVNPTSPEGPPG